MIPLDTAALFPDVLVDCSDDVDHDGGVIPSQAPNLEPGPHAYALALHYCQEHHSLQNSNERRIQTSAHRPAESVSPSPRHFRIHSASC